MSDEDRVDLQAVHFASAQSAGSSSQGRIQDFIHLTQGRVVSLPPCAIRSGPREVIYHSPASTQMAIVTCGGLCPGLNDVVRGIVLKALDYGVPEKNILGIRYGFKGFYSKTHRPIILTRKMVDDIQLEGGTMLGTSRERPDIKEVIKRLDLWKIDALFVIGGPGSHAAAMALQIECQRSKVPCCIIAIPKSIDNDIQLVDKTFGFDTAVEEAQRVLMAAKVEATSGYRGVGLVKLMGRRSGFIAVQASLASGLVDVCLIPEVSFRLDAVMAYLEEVLEKKGHAVVCVAEGAAQEVMQSEQYHGSGSDNILSPANTYSNENGDEKKRTNDALRDVGAWLKKEMKKALPDVDIKYIDPSYLIRSVPTTSADRIYCRMLANGAVHAAFAGFTGISVGLVNTHFVYLPIPIIIQAPRRVDSHGDLWNRLTSSIGQPNFDIPPMQMPGCALAPSPAGTVYLARTPTSAVRRTSIDGVALRVTM